MDSRTKADEIAVAIEAAIASGDIPADTVLRQGRLAAQYGVSRTPIREALRLSAAEGLVAFSPNRGVRVRQVRTGELIEAFASAPSWKGSPSSSQRPGSPRSSSPRSSAPSSGTPSSRTR